MAGDEFYIQVRNNKKDILDKIYLGKLRYINMFALHNWNYNLDYNLDDKTYYEMEERKEDNQIRYYIWYNDIIENIREVYYNNKPITKLEENAYEDMKYALDWIDSIIMKYNNIDFHFVFVVILD